MSANTSRGLNNGHMRSAWPLVLSLMLAHASIAAEKKIVSETDDGVRFVTNWPPNLDPARPVQLIIFACPNGNSAEMTLGAKLEPGMDWHYDIQHIAAQTRKLRQIDREHNIVVAVLEADVKNWPAWRKAHGEENGKIIRQIVDEVSRAVSGPVRV